jgi:hypothetical protein
MSWRNRRRGTLLTSSVAGVVALIPVFLMPGLADAAPPDRQEITFDGPFRVTDDGTPGGGDACGFPVYAEVLMGKVTQTTFTERGVTLLTGALKVRLTNGAPDSGGPAIERNIPGPVTFTNNPDGSVTQKTAGPGLWAFEPGKAPGLPRMAITKGRTDSVFSPEGDFTFLSQRGAVEDICAALTP